MLRSHHIVAPGDVTFILVISVFAHEALTCTVTVPPGSMCVGSTHMLGESDDLACRIVHNPASITNVITSNK